MRGQKYEFTDEQIKYILNNWGKESPHSMKKKFGCTWYAVTKVAEENGLEIPTSNTWTEEEIETLKKLSKEYHYEEIAKKMGKSKNSIYLKSRKLGLTLIQDRRKWTKQEELKLSQIWGTEPIQEIAKDLKRSVFSLKVKAIRMNLGAMILNNYDILIISDIMELLKVTRDRVCITWKKLGLKLEKQKVSNDREYYVVTMENLIDFLKNNQDEWDSRNLEMGILGEEPEWLLEKRKRDIEEDPIWYRKWTEEEEELVNFLYESGKSINEISKEMRRSSDQIRIRVRKI